ncbi:MAG: UDP-2,3-diacylglucosamine diphosphatase [Candidatus Accumulibacter sp.]|nr:UDP-2,3-diacylglucosamine diphosphatase [Accumulibacter sp.]
MLHFLSDLHLSPETPGATRLFLDYAAGEARSAGRIFILGDLFEAWPGDDAIDDPADGFARSVVDALRRLTDSGTRVAVLHGNRDFLLGERFVKGSGARLLPDPCVVPLSHGRFVLSHGDALCDDPAYQSFRDEIRAPKWREKFLVRPLAERKAIVAAMRRQSEAAKREKTPQAMDLNVEATDRFLRQHACVAMIHGHTHRPGQHEHRVDDVRVERWVLSDWGEERGEYLAWDGCRLSRHGLGRSPPGRDDRIVSRS